MSEIKAGVTLMQDFCRPSSDKYKGYIDYLDRDEVQRNHAIQTFNLFNNYMGNPEKSTGLFTDDRDALTYPEKRELKALFQTAQDNESVMWQTVISFDNRWLENNALYDSGRKIVDEAKLKEVTRLAINRLLKSEGLEHAVWSAGIHYNTDNIHIHVAAVEPYPMREKVIYQGREEVRGKFKLSNLEMCKSSVVNEIMQTREVNLKLNHIIRNEIVAAARERQFAEDPLIRKQFLELYESLPDVPRNLIHYNSSIMQPCRELIDQLSRNYIENYHTEEYQTFELILEKQSKLYAEAYGTSQREYRQTKEADLMERLGNTLLKAVKEYEKEMEIKKGIFDKQEIIIPLSYNMTAVPKRIKSENILPEDEEEIYSLNLIRSEVPKELSPELQMELEEMDAFWEKNLQSEGNGKHVENSSMEVKYKKYFAELKEIRLLLNPEPGHPVDTEKLNHLLERGEKQQNPFVLHQIGEMYLLGRILEIDKEKSQEYFQQAFQIFCDDVPYLEKSTEEEERFHFRDYLEYRIGKQYNRGWGVEKDSSAAAKYFEESGAGYARYSLGDLYYYGDGVEQDYEEAFQLYSSVENFPFADLKRGKMYEDGVGTEQSQEKAKMCYKQAYSGFLKMEKKQPDVLAEYQIGKMLYYGQGCEADLKEAIKYLELSAEKKNIPAQYLVSKIYIDGHMEEKIPKAIEQLREIADKVEHSGAQYVLGKIYTDRENGYYNLELGMEYLEKAALQGNEYAQYSAGKFYTDSTLEIYDLEKGIGYLEMAAMKDNPYAEYHLGKIYLKRDLEVHDIQKGVMYLKRSMKKGSEPAKFLLGSEYLNRESAVYNSEEGLAYMNDLAEEGNQFAQVKLGFEYLKGENVQRNLFISRYWFEKAAEQGNDLGMEMLQDLMSNSQGIRHKSGVGQLDKALMQLRKSMYREEAEALRDLKEYEWQREYEIEHLDI